MGAELGPVPAIYAYLKGIPSLLQNYQQAEGFSGPLPLIPVTLGLECRGFAVMIRSFGTTALRHSSRPFRRPQPPPGLATPALMKSGPATWIGRPPAETGLAKAGSHNFY